MVYKTLQNFPLALPAKEGSSTNGGDKENAIATVARFNVPPDSEEDNDVFADIDVESEVLWATRLYDYGKIWGEPWTLQLKAMLLEPFEMIGFYERYFYFVHIEPDARPISMVTVLVSSGVGILGNVWTSPGYRRKGCLKEIMKCVQRF